MAISVTECGLSSSHVIMADLMPQARLHLNATTAIGSASLGESGFCQFVFTNESILFTPCTPLALLLVTCARP